MSITFQLALRYVFSRKRAMTMSLIGIIFGISFFIVTQAQTSGFQTYFIRTILGTNGAIRISDRFHDMTGTVNKVSKDGVFKFQFNIQEDAEYVEGVDYPEKLRNALAQFPSIKGISEVFECNAELQTKSRNYSVQVHGIKISDHINVSEIENQIRHGSIENFLSDKMGILIGNRIAERLNLHVNDRVNVVGNQGNFQLRVSGIFETGVSEIDKKRIYLSLSTSRSIAGKRFGGSIFQLGMFDPQDAPSVATQIQHTLGHRTVSWQEREKVWLDVFKALRISSAITVSTILLLSGLGMFNVFAIMVIEKTRDVAILRSIGFETKDISSIFLWQGFIVLLGGIIGGVLFGALGTYLVSQIPLQIRGIFTTDSFVVNWNISHYIWAILIATLFVSVASWIPARRASKVEPAKIIRETI
ncbi:MAG: ABC transporter permease [Opitutae bacterium]|nr:ABC transporter permease [Opitutae bacterium]MBT5716652.1 ABC transporter permease [Opitutae bacterium]